MKTERISAGISIIVTSEDIDDIVATALEGGINYWCCRAEVVGEYLGEYASDQISRDGRLKLYDAEEDEVYELDKGKVLNGVMRLFKNGTCGRDVFKKSGLEYTIDCCQVVAVVADMIIQYAVFGEIIYG